MKVKINRRLGQNKSGTVLDLTTDEAQWLVGRRLAIYVPDPVRTAVVAETETESDDEQFPSATLAELKAKADELGVPTYGTKAQILERIANRRGGGDSPIGRVHDRET